MNYVAYTNNNDGSVNILAGSPNPSVFPVILPKGTVFNVHEGEVYTANGKTFLSDTDEAYLEEKAQEEKQKSLNDLDNQYDKDKATLMDYFTQAIFAGDEEEMQELREEMEEVDAQYVADREAILNGGK